MKTTIKASGHVETEDEYQRRMTNEALDGFGELNEHFCPDARGFEEFCADVMGKACENLGIPPHLVKGTYEYATAEMIETIRRDMEFDLDPKTGRLDMTIPIRLAGQIRAVPISVGMENLRLDEDGILGGPEND